MIDKVKLDIAERHFSNIKKEISDNGYQNRMGIFSELLVVKKFLGDIDSEKVKNIDSLLSIIKEKRESEITNEFDNIDSGIGALRNGLQLS